MKVANLNVFSATFIRLFIRPGLLSFSIILYISYFVIFIFFAFLLFSSMKRKTISNYDKWWWIRFSNFLFIPVSERSNICFNDGSIFNIKKGHFCVCFFFLPFCSIYWIFEKEKHKNKTKLNNTMCNYCLYGTMEFSNKDISSRCRKLEWLTKLAIE